PDPGDAPDASERAGEEGRDASTRPRPPQGSTRALLGSGSAPRAHAGRRGGGGRADAFDQVPALSQERHEAAVAEHVSGPRGDEHPAVAEPVHEALAPGLVAPVEEPFGERGLAAGELAERLQERAVVL